MSTPKLESVRSFTRTARHGAQRRSAVDGRLRAAVEELLGQGHAFSELSVERIAVAAGLSRSSFYRYHADKGALLIALTDDVVSGLSDAGRIVWTLPPEAPRGEIGAAIGDVLALGWSDRVMLRAIVEAEAYDPAVRERREHYFSGAVDFVAAHIRQGQQHGWIRSTLDPDATAEWLCLMTDRGLVSTVARADENDIPRLATSLTDIVWYTLYDGLRDPRGRRE
jgi:TetR/AcrR family transcriptional regulator, ethionamide resistance regulator